MSNQNPILLTNTPCWESLLNRINGACVFVDDTVAECLHWSGSASILDKAGAIHVRQFSSFEDIIKESHFRNVLLVSTLPPDAHCDHFTKSGEIFDKLEVKIMKMINKPISSAEVIYLPLAYAPITDSIFYLPSCATLFPLLPTDWKTLRHITAQSKLTSNSSVELSDFPSELQSSLKNLVFNLHSFLSHHDIGEDVFFVGETSEIIANEIASLNVAKLRRGAAANKSSLLIIDRSLDVTSAIGHHSDSLLDRILRTLPKYCDGRNRTDISVDMSEIVASSGDQVCKGCLASCEALPHSRHLLTILAERKQRESINEVYRAVGLGVLKEKLTDVKSKLSGRINAASIETQIKFYKNRNKSIIKYSNTLTVALATIQTLKHQYSSMQDAMFGIEKGLLQNIGEVNSGEALNSIKYKLLDNENEFTLDDILQLLIYFYGLCDMSDVKVEEKELMDSLIEKIEKIEKEILSNDMKKLFYDGNGKIELIVKEIFYKLRGISTSRLQLQQYTKVYQGGDITSQATMNPVLRQILNDALNITQPARDLTDIKHVSTGLKDMIKSGFGFLMNRAAARPHEQPLLIVFVIGGITISEARKMQEMAKKTNSQILIGSTTISTPQDLMKMILIQDNMQAC